jgi:hypothetical protein
VSDETVPQHLKDDPELWSGCVSGAFGERELLRELESAGFHGIAIEEWNQEPFAVIEGIEFRAVTVSARKGKQGECWEGNQAVIYAGPWKRVEDDDGHVLERGARTAVCEKTFRLLTTAPYAAQTIGIAPRVPLRERRPFDCSRIAPRDPRETKAGAPLEARAPCADESCC